MAKKAARSTEQEVQKNANMDTAKKAMLDKAVGDIIKNFGEGSIMPLGKAHAMVTEVFPTGSLSLDIALGVGGIPRGRIMEIYGPESSGKTTLCQHIVAEAQKKTYLRCSFMHSLVQNVNSNRLNRSEVFRGSGPEQFEQEVPNSTFFNPLADASASCGCQ